MGSGRKLRLGVALAASMVLLATAAVPLISSGADHLDAPALSPGRLEADINDLYVFQGADPNNTVLAMTVSPAAGAIGPDTFGTDVLYQFNLVDAPTASLFGFTADEVFVANFGAPDSSGNQSFELYKGTGLAPPGDHTLTSRTLIHSGTTNQNTTFDTMAGAGTGKFFAGLRSDPFFFDLGGFQGQFGEASNGRAFNDGNETAFFEDLNVLALVLEIPDTVLPDSGDDGIAVWASTAIDNPSNGWDQVDRIGRPAINTVVNSTGSLIGAPSGNKDLFNTSHPGGDSAFEQVVKDALAALSAADSEGAYGTSEQGFIASLFLPDKLFFDDGSTPSAPFNGRRLEDDVIDIELNILTGGLATVGRDNMGAITTDGIGPHDDYLSVFPYLGEPHAVTTPNPDISVSKDPSTQTNSSGGIQHRSMWQSAEMRWYSMTRLRGIRSDSKDFLTAVESQPRARRYTPPPCLRPAKSSSRASSPRH